MSDNTTRFTAVQKIGIGAAIVAVPLAGLGYQHLVRVSREGDEAKEKSYSYDVSALRQVDPSLVKYTELKRMETGLTAPKAIAVDKDGSILVAGDRVVRRFTTGGSFSDISLTEAPYCVAAGPEGMVLVGFKTRVEVYGKDGQKKASWGDFGAGSYLTCITVSGNDVYVADAGRRVVLRCTPEGKVVNEIGKKDDAKGIPGLVLPSEHLDVAVAADGLVWVNNPGRHRLEAYTPEGNLEKFWGVAGTTIDAFVGCCNPTDFALLSDGSFITGEKGVVRIKRYLGDGRFEGMVASPTMFADNNKGADIAVTAEGRVLVLEQGQKAIRVFDHE